MQGACAVRTAKSWLFVSAVTATRSGHCRRRPLPSGRAHLARNVRSRPAIQLRGATVAEVVKFMCWCEGLMFVYLGFGFVVVLWFVFVVVFGAVGCFDGGVLGFLGVVLGGELGGHG